MKIEERIKNSNKPLSGVEIVLIDMQENLIQGILNKDELIDSLLLLIQSIKIFKLPLIVTEQVPEKLGPTLGVLSSQFPNENPIAKNSFSIFGSSEFCDHLNNNSISHLILSGIETPICVYLSAIDALKEGYEVTILSDCVGSRRTEDERVIFRKLENAGCHILPLESFLYGCLGNAEHSDFREISKLVRDRIKSL